MHLLEEPLCTVWSLRLAGDSPSPSRRRARQAVPMLDRLEERVVLSHGHHVHHLATVAHVSTTAGDDDDHAPARHGTTQDATLTADLKQFETDLTTALAGSKVTDAQRLALANDLATIRQAGVTVDTTALARGRQPVDRPRQRHL